MWMSIVVIKVPNVLSSLSSRSFMVFVRCFLVISGLRSMTLFIACIFSAIASITRACARRMAVLVEFVLLIFLRCDMKSMNVPTT